MWKSKHTRATDRSPIEMLFGVTFAWMATKLARKIYLYRTEASARVNSIRDRNSRIRRAAHQAIRVIREEVDRIDLALTEIFPI